jgi:myo-inositol-1(or 4)-monophosphatase
LPESSAFLHLAVDVAIAAAQAGGRAAMRARQNPLECRDKGPRDLVTNGDLAAQEAVLGEIRGAFPDHGVLSEEGADSQGQNGYRWIVDPVDGTTNYFRGLPMFSVSVGLARDAELLAGAVYDPSRQETFHGASGMGAFLNGVPIQAADTDLPSQCLFGLGLPYDIEATRRQLAMARAVVPRCAAMRTLGSAALALCYVACGRLDAYVHPYLHPWDAAAGVLIVRQGGGIVGDLYGARWDFDSREIVATSPRVHQELLRLVQDGYRLA